MATKENKVISLPEASSEIQYLDLALDSDASSSPRTPNHDVDVDHRHNVKLGKDSLPTVSLPPPSSNSFSSVYKTIDFVKTKAFNKTRMGRNLEEINRNSEMKK